MRRLTLLLPLAIVAAARAQVPAASFGHYSPAPQFNEIATTSFYLPMRDGTRLAMQVSRPARDGRPIDGRFPVIWEAGIALPPVPQERPDDSPATGFADWSRLVSQGYVIVTVARRGNGQSMGTVRGYHDREEAYDAYEITEWLARQPWSDGKVGMHGCSNTGEAVMHALTVAPPHLKAAWAGCFSWSKYDGFLRGGGIVANWGAGPQRTVEQDMAQRPVDRDGGKLLLKQAATDHRRNSNLGALLRSVPFRDSWSPLSRSVFAVEDSASTYMDQIRRAGVPLTIQGGWYDDFRGQAFVTLANLPNARLLIGPWRHCRSDGFDLVGEAQRFFDYHLKGIDTGLAAEPPIHYYLTGAAPDRAWRSAAAWPVSGAGRSLYLADEHLLARPRTGASRGFTVDPAPACDEAPAAGNLAAPFIQPCHRDRGTVSFTGEAVARDQRLVGHPVARVWITADGADANLFAYLEDVAPDGRVEVLTEGRLKASLRRTAQAPWAMMGLPWHRGFGEDAEPLVPGRPAELAFDLLPIAHLVAAGHRLRLTLAGSDPRESDRALAAVASRLTVLTDAAHRSVLIVPLLDGRDG